MSSSLTFKAFATSCRVLPITSSQALGEKLNLSLQVWVFGNEWAGSQVPTLQGVAPHSDGCEAAQQ